MARHKGLYSKGAGFTNKVRCKMTKDKTVKAISIILILLFSLALLPVGIASAQSQPKVVNVGYFDFSGYHEVDENGKLSGWGYDYLQEIAKYANIVYKYTYCTSWGIAKEMLARGDVDILTSATWRDEMDAQFDKIPTPMGMKSTMITVKAGNQNLRSDNYTEWPNIKVGVLNSNSKTHNDNFVKFATEKGIKSYEFVIIANSNDETSEDRMDKELESGNVDVLVSSSLRKTTNEWLIDSINMSPFYAIVKDGDPKGILNEINDAIEKIQINSPTFSESLYKQHYKIGDASLIQLTSEERLFIQKLNAQKKVFQVLVRPNSAPMSYFENGEAKGAMVAIMNELARRIDININYIFTANEQAYYDKIKNRKADLVCDVDHDYGKAELYKYKLTDCTLKVKYVELTLKNPKNGQKTVASINKGDIYERYILNNFSSDQIKIYPSISDCVKAVRNGEVTSFYLDKYTAQYSIYNDLTNKLVLIPKCDFTENNCIAVNTNVDIQLISILNKAIVSLDEDTKDALIAEYVGLGEKPFSFIGYFYNNPVKAAIALIIILIFVFTILISILVVHSKKKEMQAIEKTAEFGAVVCEAYDDVIEWDIVGDFWSKLSINEGHLTKFRLEGTASERIKDIYDTKLHPEDKRTVSNFKINDGTLGNSLLSITDECRIKLEGSDTYSWYSYMLKGLPKEKEKKHNCVGRTIKLFSKKIDKDVGNEEKVINTIFIGIKNIDNIRRREEEIKSQIKEALINAQQANRAKTDFLSKMSHEIRTPINAMVGFMAIAKTKIDDKNRVLDCINKGELATKHLLQIINDVLDMSAIESGKIQIAQAPFLLSGFIASVTSIFYAQAKLKNIDFKIETEGVTEEKLLGDQLRLNQILINLLSNAIKFTAQNGIIILRVTQEIIKANVVFFMFEVIDNGIGMSQKFIDKIGTPFVQENANIAQKFGGSGLGLSITKNLIQLMDGVMIVESKEGEGTRFCVKLPIMLNPDKREDELKKTFKTTNALVVDDEFGTCEYTLMLLNNCGVKGEYSLSGIDAVEKAVSAHANKIDFDICFIDWKMPEMDGIETTRQMRKRLGNDLPIVIITAFDYSSIEAEAREAGVTYFAPKPLFQSTVYNILMETRGLSAGSKADETSVENYDFTGKNIILAEDNDMNMEIASEILSDTKLNIFAVSNGKEAVDMFNNKPNGFFDALILDVQMPIMDGYEATRIIRKSELPYAKRVPIVAMTANVFAEDIANALAAGMNNHVAKPIDSKQLFALLKQCFDGNKFKN
ncbi:MAG: response regulator [Clostridia bacterium]